MSDVEKKHSGGRPSKPFNFVEAVMLKLKGLSCRKIAERLDVSKSTVERKLSASKQEPTVMPAPGIQEPPAAVARVDASAEPVPTREVPIDEPKHPLHGLDALLTPGAKVSLPEPPAVVPVAKAEPVEPQAAIDNPDTRPIDWDEEAQTNLPTRTPRRIAFLLRHESTEQTKRRITNDLLRYRYAKGYAGFDVQ